MIGAQNGNPTKLTLPALRDRNERACAGLWAADAAAAAERADLRPMNERANMRAGGGRRIHYLRDIFDLRNRVNV